MPNALILCADTKLSESLAASVAALGLSDPQLFTSWEDCHAAIQNWNNGDRGWLLLSCQTLLPGGFERLMVTHDALRATGGRLVPTLVVEPDCASEQTSIQQMLGVDHAIELDSMGGEEPEHGKLTACTAQIVYELFEIETEYYEAPKGPVLEAGPQSTSRVLPYITEGSLSDISLPQLFYNLFRRHAAGILRLEKGGRQLTLTVLGGQPGRQNSGDGADLSTLQAAFAWRDGTYIFAPKMIPGHTFLPFGKGLSSVYSSLQKLSTNQVAQNLDPFLKHYPAVTSLIDEHGARFKKEPFFDRFCDACNGRKTLEEVITAIGMPPGEVLPWIAFAIETDLITLFETPKKVGLIRMTYTLEDADPDWKPDLELPMTAEQRDLFDELSYKMEYLRDNDPYVVFELEPGCGTRAAKEQYVGLIKENHPDVYGGNIREEIKRLAEEVFILLKNSYEKLRDTEARNDPSGDKVRSIKSNSTSNVSNSISRSSIAARTSSTSQPRQAATPKPNPPQSRPPKSPQSRPPRSPQSRSSKPPAVKPTRPRSQKPKKLDLGLADASKRDSSPRQRAVRGKPGKPPRPSPSRPTSSRSRPRPDGARPRQPRSSSSPGRSPGGHSKTPMTLPGKSRSDLRQQFKPLDHFKNGQKYLQKERYSHAAEAFRLASDMEENNGKFKAHFAWANYMNDPNDKSVMKLLQEASKLENGARDSFLFLGQISKAQGEHDKARHFFKKVLELDPDCVEALREVRLFNMRNEGKSKSSSKDNAKGKAGAKKAGATKAGAKKKGSKTGEEEGGFWGRFKSALCKKR